MSLDSYHLPIFHPCCAKLISLHVSHDLDSVNTLLGFYSKVHKTSLKSCFSHCPFRQHHPQCLWCSISSLLGPYLHGHLLVFTTVLSVVQQSTQQFGTRRLNSSFKNACTNKNKKVQIFTLQLFYSKRMKKTSIFFLYKWGFKKSFIISFEGTYLTFNINDLYIKFVFW